MMVIVARVIRFLVVLYFAALLLALAARFFIAELDTLPDEEPITVALFSHSVPAGTFVGIAVWVPALLIEIVDFRRNSPR